MLIYNLGSVTIESRTRMAFMAAKNLLAGFRGEQFPNCLNWGEVCRLKGRMAEIMGVLGS
jgi:hypothetical protein